MFNQLDKLMHERPVNQTALAAWAMRMHGLLRKELPELTEVIAQDQSLPWDNTAARMIGMNSIANWARKFHAMIVETDQGDV